MSLPGRPQGEARTAPNEGTPTDAAPQAGGLAPSPLTQTAQTAHTAQLHVRPVRRLFAFVLVVLLASQLAVSLFAWSLAEKQFLPELERKAQTVGVSLANKLTRALGYGIPLDRLVGVDEFFSEVLRDNEDLAFLSLTDGGGRVLFRSGEAPEPGAGAVAGAARPIEVTVAVNFEGRQVGQLHVGVDRQYIASRIAGLRYDIAIVLITSLLIAFEILWLVVTLNLSAPLRQAVEVMARMASGDFRERSAGGPGRSLGEALNRIETGINQAYAELLRLAAEPGRRLAASPLLEGLQRRYRFAEEGVSRPVADQRLTMVRILTVLFMLAEMLSRPFLPIYAGGLSDHGLGLSEGLRSSLPITAFLLAVAVAMPYAGRWSDQIGRRRSYITGAFFVATGLAISGLAPEYLVLMIARAITGLGYAMMFMSCQGLVIDHTTPKDRGKGFAMVVSAIAIAQICAPPIGGILADNVGYKMVFLVGAGVALVAATVASRLLDNSITQAQHAPPAARMRLSVLYRNHRFWTLSVLSGIPAQLIYTGFLSYLVPTLLVGMGSTQSEIGRDSMVYGLVVVGLVPLFAWCAERFNTHALSVSLGGMLTGLGLLSLQWEASPRAVVLGIAALGLGHSMSISAQLVLVTRATQGEALLVGSGPVLGVFRLMERLGAAAGPVAAGLLVASLGAPRATVWLGAFGVAASVLFTLAFFLTGRLAPRSPPP